MTESPAKPELPGPPTATGLSQQAQSTLVQALRNPACYPHPVDTVEVLETHISWVLLAGEFAYKLKKNVNFGFLDFSSLDKRKHCCDEELRLNQRQAGDLYLEVIAIVGAIARPHLGGEGEALEYAVKMRRFDQSSLLDQRLQMGEITPADMNTLAHTLAAFHHSIDRADAHSTFGRAADIERYTLENIAVVGPRLKNPADLKRLAGYSRWLEDHHSRLTPLFEARRQQGFVRECHGDLHLGNITFSGGHFHFFDCIEFNADLRWVDIVSELAFLAMDLEARGHADFSRQLINHYFEVTGDYSGAALLPYYLAYRAMVRAKVAMLRWPQAHDDAARQTLENSCRDYLCLAVRYANRQSAAVIITHGLSGSGKSTHTTSLVGQLGAIRLRSDVERKRLFARDIGAPSGVGHGLYTQETTRATYSHLLDKALSIVSAGLPVIIDATFLQGWQRDLFRLAASQRGIPFFILDFPAEIATLEQRIRQRQQQASDASDATIDVLHAQLRTHEPLTPEETPHVITLERCQDAPGWQALLRTCLRE